jgi:NO-binding membrane sensor protein with MHYT domain
MAMSPFFCFDPAAWVKSPQNCFIFLNRELKLKGSSHSTLSIDCPRNIVYDPTLVMLSILVAILGSLTGVAVTFGYGGSRVVLSPQALVRGAVIIGGSIWSMHFIAMLAVKFPVAITYNSTQTLLSLCLAVLFTGVGLSLASAKRWDR